MRHIKYRVASLLLCLFFGQAHAGAWLQDEGKGLFIAQGTYFTDDEYFNRKGDKQSQPRYTKYEAQPYIEYGLLPNLTIGGTAFFQNDSQSGTTNNGMADPTIFARTRLWYDAKQVVSIEPLLKFESAFENAGSPRGGSGSTDAQMSLLYGRNLHLVSANDYLDVESGYRYRSGDLNDQWHADVSMGLEVLPNLQIIPALRTTFATHIPHTTGFSENGDQDYDLIKLELGGLYHLPEGRMVGLTVFDLIDGHQVGNGAGVTLTFGQSF